MTQTKNLGGTYPTYAYIQCTIKKCEWFTQHLWYGLYNESVTFCLCKVFSAHTKHVSGLLNMYHGMVYTRFM